MEQLIHESVLAYVEWLLSRFLIQHLVSISFFDIQQQVIQRTYIRYANAIPLSCVAATYDTPGKRILVKLRCTPLTRIHKILQLS